MADIAQFPVSKHLSPQELLAAASKKPWKKVLIIGAYEGETLLRHATGMSNAEAVYILELAKQVFLGMAHEADLELPEADAE